MRRQVGRIKREEIHRYPLGSKREGVARLTFESFDWMASWMPRNWYIVQRRKVLSRIQADM